MSIHVDRRFLYPGLFLVVLGGVVVAGDVNGIDAGSIVDAVRLWPLLPIAIGMAVVLRRTRFGLASAMLAAAVAGLLLGSGLALAARVAGDCVGTPGPSSVDARTGTFDDPARVSVAAGCGSLLVTTSQGNAWAFAASEADSPPATVSASAGSLSVTAGSDGSWSQRTRHQGWRLTVPTTSLDNLSVAVHGGDARLDLPGAKVGVLQLTTIAGRTVIDLSGSTVATLSASVTAGELSMRLGASADLVGALTLTAGSLKLCLSNDLGLQLHRTGAFNGLSVDGQYQSGADWLSPGSATAVHHATLTVNVNLGDVQVNPIGGCA